MRLCLLTKLIIYCARHLAEIAVAPYADPKVQADMVKDYQERIDRATMHIRGFRRTGPYNFSAWTRTFPVGTSITTIIKI